MPNQASPSGTTEKRVARSPKIEVPLLERAALSPNEFAALFGKQTTWGYRQIYAGNVKVLKSLGRAMIPITEVKRLLSCAEAVK